MDHYNITAGYSDETEDILRSLFPEGPADLSAEDDVTEAVRKAAELDEYPAFHEGLAERLNQLGISCTLNDTEIMLEEIKNRFRIILGKSCPRAVKNWIKGTTPGLTNHLNNYDLCYALEMDTEQTESFFQKCFLTLPWNCKNKTDAVFLYCFHHRKPYSAVKMMLGKTECFVSQKNAHTSTSQIMTDIISENDDEKFLKYLSAHCYDNQQQFQTARNIIKTEIENVKEKIRNNPASDIISPERLNSNVIAELLGYRYQIDVSSRNGTHSLKRLPKRFTESLPNDVTIGKIINDETVSYETLRKTLILLKLYTFYYEAENTDENVITQNLMDFRDELNSVLSNCGFACIYPLHPFDNLVLYCAYSYDPILTMRQINEYGFIST